MSEEVWKYTPDNILNSNNIKLSSNEVQRSEQDVQQNYVRAFGHRDFMSCQAQGLDSFPMHNAYDKEEESFKKTVQMVHVSDMPLDANVITSHVIYKVKNNDDGTKK